MQTLGIGEIARQAGVAPSTIRYYERIGLLPPAPRVSGKRRYQTGILKKLGVIRLAKMAGFSIEEIQTLLHDFPAETPASERWQALSSQKIVEIDALIQQAQAMRATLEQTLDCHCDILDDCAGDSLGIQKSHDAC